MARDEPRVVVACETRALLVYTVYITNCFVPARADVRGFSRTVYAPPLLQSGRQRRRANHRRYDHLITPPDRRAVEMGSIRVFPQFIDSSSENSEEYDDRNGGDAFSNSR